SNPRDHASPLGQEWPRDHSRSSEGARKYLVAAGCNIEEIQKSQEVLRHLKQAQRMTERCGVHNDGAVLAALERIVDGKQCGDLCHAGKCGVEQRLDLLAGEDGPTL